MAVPLRDVRRDLFLAVPLRDVCRNSFKTVPRRRAQGRSLNAFPLRRTDGDTVKTVPPGRRAIVSFRLHATRIGGCERLAIRTSVVPNRPFFGAAVFTPARVRGGASALSIVGAEIKVQLVLRSRVWAIWGLIPEAALLPAIFAEALTPFVLCFWFPMTGWFPVKGLGFLAVAALLASFVAETLPRLHFRFTITLARRRRVSVAAIVLIAAIVLGVVTELLPLAVSFAFPPGLGGRITVAALLACIIAEVLPLLILRFAIPVALGARLAMAALLPAIVAEISAAARPLVRDRGGARAAAPWRPCSRSSSRNWRRDSTADSRSRCGMGGASR